MAELALGALGVVPLIGFTIKSYTTLYTTLKTFRNCDSNVERLRKRLRGQRRIFENECLLLLHGCLQDSDSSSIDIEGMMADPAHEDWLNHELMAEDDLKRSLMHNYDECIALVQDIGEVIKKIQISMAPFEKVVSAEGDHLRKSWKSISDGTKICLHKKDYEDDLEELRSNNITLKTLREQVNEMKKPRSNIIKKRPAIRSVYWTDIQQASKTLYEALAKSWSCTQSRHLRHAVKLFVEAQRADDGVHMDIAIFGHRYELTNGMADMIRLQVRSTITILPATRLLVPSAGSSNDNSRPQKRVKRVRFSRDTSPPHAADMSSCPQITDYPPFPDLQRSADICSELTTLCGQRVAGATTACLGYLDIASEDSYRHEFFSTSQYLGRQLGPRAVDTGDLTPLDTILNDSPTSDFFLPVDRLRIARVLVLAVLKFHATPWLREAWQLQEFAFFHYSQDLARSLQTLHIGVEFESLPRGRISERVSSTSFPGEDQTGATGPQDPLTQMSEDERILSGIPNTTLHCLGVGLLQIERSQPMDPRDAAKARKTAMSVADLGNDYRDLVEKCLWCDFGLGRDLGKPQLQQAVYTSVVDVLDRMIAKLGIDDDNE